MSLNHVTTRALVVFGIVLSLLGPVGAATIGSRAVSARPGDLNRDGVVDFADAAALSTQDGGVTFQDAFDVATNYASAYATTEGIIGDFRLTLLYNQSTGVVTLEGPQTEQYKALKIDSASAILHIGAANWLSLTGLAAPNFVSNTASLQGFATLAPGGNTFLPMSGYVIGALLDPNLSPSFLTSDLTITYAVQGIGAQFNGDVRVVPEPSSGFLVIGGMLTAVVAARAGWLSAGRRRLSRRSSP